MAKSQTWVQFNIRLKPRVKSRLEKLKATSHKSFPVLIEEMVNERYTKETGAKF